MQQSYKYRLILSIIRFLTTVKFKDMLIRNKEKQFQYLRGKYPVFSYDSYDYRREDGDLLMKFQFSIGKDICFCPESKLKYHPSFDALYANEDLSLLDDFVFSIGMIEMISCWKATCSPIVRVEVGNLDNEEISFWKKLYYHGLGEFFYCNSIKTSLENFMKIEILSPYKKKKLPVFGLKNETIIPVGGGKDSVVTLELLRKCYEVTPMVINPRKATMDTVAIGGFSDNYFEIQRKIDPVLLDLNKQGFLNGHTPFSAMLAFYSVLLAVVSGKKNIALSNESSANESTVIGSDVNHQYSKSYEFEADFRNYVSKYLSKEVNYYSFLRPLNELQIAYLFSKQSDYLSVFRSCNAGSKTDEWCCNCAKCLFTFIILSPFVNPERLTAIFGENLFEKEYLLPVFQELCGLTAEKPFECVGTIDEVCLALIQTLKQYDTLPFLLKYFTNTPLYEQYRDMDFENQMQTLDAQHFLPEEKMKLIKSKIVNRKSKI